MTVFIYRAKTPAGEVVCDRIDAENAKLAALKIRSSGLFPVEIAPQAEKTPWSGRLAFRRKRIARKEILRFTSRLVDLLKGGLQVSRALGVLERQTDNRAMKNVIKGLREGVQAGKALSEKLGEYPELFPKMYTGVIRAGESAGLLEAVLERLAEFGEKEEQLKHKIRSALAYPAIMFTVGLASVVFIMTFVIPKFEMMFRETGQTLPLPTRVLLFASDAVTHGWWIGAPALAAICFLAQRRLATEKGKNDFDRALISLPVIGDLLKKERVARSIRTLSALLRNGVPLLDALALVEESSGSSLFRGEIRRIRQSVKEGKGLVEPLRTSGLFPPMVAEMVAIGEETGSLEGALLRVASAYENEVDYSVKTLTSLLEPLIILVMGVMIGFVAVAMLLPVFQMSAVIR